MWSFTSLSVPAFWHAESEVLSSVTTECFVSEFKSFPFTADDDVGLTGKHDVWDDGLESWDEGRNVLIDEKDRRGGMGVETGYSSFPSPNSFMRDANRAALRASFCWMTVYRCSVSASFRSLFSANAIFAATNSFSARSYRFLQT